MARDDEGAVRSGGVRIADAVFRKLNRLEEYVKLLEGLRGRDFADPYLRGALERYLQLSAECVLDIGEMLIALRGLPKAQKYREILPILGTAGVIDDAFARELAPIASLRNVLVHDYERIDLGRLVSFLSRLDDLRRYGREVAAFLMRAE